MLLLFLGFGCVGSLHLVAKSFDSLGYVDIQLLKFDIYIIKLRILK